MGNLNCDLQDSGHLAAVARDFCPFPDYSPSPLLNMLSANSSALLSERYAAVQASLTPRQQQEFTQTLRATFGREGKVSYGAVGVVALSLAVLFDTVAREVKGEHVSHHQPIPGVFLKDPRGTYSPPVYTVSRYLRLVPYIANNPTRMRQETEKYFYELNCVTILGLDNKNSTQWGEDIIRVNFFWCLLIKYNMFLHVKRISNKTLTIRPNEIRDLISDHNYETIELPNLENLALSLNCDAKEANDRFVAKLDSFRIRTKEAFKNCVSNNMRAMKNIATLHWFFNVMMINAQLQEREELLALTADFDLKTKSLGKWT